MDHKNLCDSVSIETLPDAKNAACWAFLFCYHEVSLKFHQQMEYKLSTNEPKSLGRPQ